MRCRVETYSGFRIHERPRRFSWGDFWLEVDRITEQWVTPDHLCFKVKVKDRAYLLKYHQAQDFWEAEALEPGIRPGD